MDLSMLSNAQTELVSKILEHDGGFHSQGFVANYPFAECVTIADDGTEIVSNAFQTDIDTDYNSYNFEIRYSDELECYFVKVSNGGDEYTGQLRFNVLENARGSFAFVVLNNNVGGTLNDITYNIQFSNVLILER